MMDEVGVRLSFEGNLICICHIDKEIDYKVAWRKVKSRLQRVSYVVETEFTWTKDIINHDDARTNGGDKNMESSESVGSKRTL